MTILTINKTHVADIPVTVKDVPEGSFFTLNEDDVQIVYLKVNKSSNNAEYNRAVVVSSGYVRQLAHNLRVRVLYTSATLDLVEKISET